jgi:hypothetical protein
MTRHARPLGLLATLIALVALAALAAPPAHAADLTIPLPDLAGGYEYHPTVAPNFGYPGLRATTFTFPDGMVDLASVELMISGSWNVGEITCTTGGPDNDSSPFLSPLGLYLTSDDFPGYFVTTVEVVDGPFTALTGTLRPGGWPEEPVLEDLVGAEISAELYHDAAIIGICWVSVDPWGTVNDIILAVSGTVPVAATTFSAIRALYD